MKLDVLVFAAHPDDAELACSGTIAKWNQMGFQIGIIDFTQGELGTRGTPELRLKESHVSKEILGLKVRENLGFRDGFFQNDEHHQRLIIEKIRKYQPTILLINAPKDRHPDHGRAAQLAKDAAFLSRLVKIVTFDNGIEQKPWCPKSVLHYIQDKWISPSFVVDISDFFEIKLQAIKAFSSQFYDPNSQEPQTYISTPEFWQGIESRAMEMGRLIGTKYGEGFISENPIPVHSPEIFFYEHLR